MLASSSTRHTRTTRPEKTSFMDDLRDMAGRYLKRTSPQHKRAILLLIVAGALLRGWMLLQPVTYDEARAYELFISRPFTTILSDLTDPLNHILHSVLAKFSLAVFGGGLIALRLPSFIAAVLAMPLFYLFVRAMFNRYIAMLALALVAASAPLVEYGALAHGYSITWLCMVAGLVLGRHLAQTNNPVSALLMGVGLALGMWSMPAMIYPALGIYIWMLFYIIQRYEGSVKIRVNMVFTSLITFGVLTLLFHLPVILDQGIGQLWDHPSLPESNWKSFKRAPQEGGFELWVAIVDTTGTWLAMLGILALLFSAFISSKYRMLMFAAALGAIPLVLLKARVAPPAVWYYTLFLFHIGTAIALFYLLKFLQEKVFPSLGKRTRTWVASLVLLAGFAFVGIPVVKERIPRYADARAAGAYLAEALAAGDRAYVEHPWDSPVKFHAMSRGLSRARFNGEPALDTWVFVLVAPSEGQDLEQVLAGHRIALRELEDPALVRDMERIGIFAARYRGVDPAVED